MSIAQSHPAGWFVNPTPGATTQPLIVGIGGTTRPQSSSQRALERCLSFTRESGAETVLLSGPQLPTGIYDPSRVERSAEALDLVRLLRRADGVILASPAYHGSISGHLKNALDFTEDMRGDARSYLDGRAVGLICTAMGWQAGGTTLAAMRAITHALRGWPTPLGVMINTAVTSFDSNGCCLDAATDDQLRMMAKQVVEFAEMKMLAAATQSGMPAPLRVAAEVP
ncbi:NADPH-dependent FMN reductase [Allorhizobium pseudoryzae]|uniref:NADPH-dependent FMN reductase n=1 Tax=Allorhizobium pseudoryzae TaxID=379684 RepID=UPI003D0272D1